MAEPKGRFRDTRGAFIDAALSLIGERSFESTSVDAIVAKAELSKGTFFHYFATKDDLLEAVCDWLATRSFLELREALEGKEEGDDPLQQLRRYLAESRRYRVKNAKQVGELWDALQKDHNAALRMRVREHYRKKIQPLMAHLVSLGERAKQFDVDDVSTTTDLLLDFVDASAEGTMRLLRDGGPGAIERARLRVNATLDVIERMLRLKPGVLDRVERAELERFQRPPKKP